MSFNPQTPQSPSQLSPSTADPVSSSMNSSMTSITTLPTPAHSVNGSIQHGDSTQDIAMSDADSPHKRKRMPDDMGEPGHKKTHLEDPRRLGIEDLHMDVGEKYFLCRTPHSVSLPSVSEDLFEMFGLTGIAAEVARTKPNGEKNALRKTYKGHIKSLGVNGHFDKVEKDPYDQDGFMHMLLYPESEWHVHEVQGKEVERGFSDAVQTNLSRAMTMARTLDKELWDSSVLGDLAPSVVTKKPKEGSKKATPIGSAGGLSNASKLQVPQVNRVRRIGKKRSYQDSSFEGYGDGFPDDDQGAASGYSTGEGDDRSSKLKRRKQNPGTGSSFGGSVRNGYSGIGT
ncbi:hypothetical protein PG994_014968 [Apiospora phragmitis]|uniref:Mediator of RNA polymerase II transcription subunit 19 n=1 Tax=Apiospora phragmitis TaxID=2905665 RepID=A0ABR1SV70_9PEZI